MWYKWVWYVSSKKICSFYTFRRDCKQILMITVPFGLVRFYGKCCDNSSTNPVTSKLSLPLTLKVFLIIFPDLLSLFLLSSLILILYWFLYHWKRFDEYYSSDNNLTIKLPKESIFFELINRFVRLLIWPWPDASNERIKMSTNV